MPRAALFSSELALLHDLHDLIGRGQRFLRTGHAIGQLQQTDGGLDLGQTDAGLLDHLMHRLPSPFPLALDAAT